MPSRFSVALKATGNTALKVVGILVVQKAMTDRNVNSHCCQVFSSSEKLLRCQQLTGRTVPSRFTAALIATGTSVLNVVGILVALKATVTEEGGRSTGKENPKSGRPTFLTVWWTHM